MALVAFLRGINVGGHRSFRPSVLAQDLARYQVVNVGTAGTFVIRRPVSRVRLRTELARRLPFAAHVMICEGRELLALGRLDPFRRAPRGPKLVHFVSILAARPRLAPATPIHLPSVGRWMVRILGRENRLLFGLYRREMKVISYLGLIDQVFGVPVTTRSWSTIVSITNLLENPDS